ncbi:holin [Paenibacillus bouchesdurhonensis]|uniref:holin n=1 Tax=Paenibacillus bouchesdurhonensis TaxID=1870990 RepID=UPI000DA6284F|nr:holin [Paenibacillus bouchesdurhonensis]
MTTKWIKAAGIRAIKTAAQTAIGVIGATTVFSDVEWYVVGGTVLLATITSLLMSLAGLPEVEEQ